MLAFKSPNIRFAMRKNLHSLSRFCLLTLYDNSLITIVDDACELRVNSSALLLSVDKTWSSTDDPCTLYKCTSKSGREPQIEIERRECNTTCGDDFAYKTLPNECCGKCFATVCTSDDKKFKAGDIWKSADNCTVHECIDTGSDLFVTSYKKNCPKLKNCPQENIETRDCCPYCNYRSQSKLVKL